MRVGFFVLLIMTLPGALFSQPASPPWPREVQAIYNDFKTQCRAGGGKFVPDKAGYAHQIEVTNDGKPDWVVEIASLQCVVSQAIRESGNGPETGTDNCGTAGCSTMILGSGRTGLSEIYNDTIRSWTVVDLGGGRKGLETSVHGTACGGFGADVCMQTLRWNGKKWEMIKQYKWTDDDHLKAQQEQSADSYVAPPQHSAKWVFAGKGESAIAAVTDHPEMTALGLRCLQGGGLGITIVPMPGLKLPPPGQPLQLSFSGSADGLEATQTLVPEPGKKDYSAVLDYAVRGLLSGKDDGLELLASADGGGEWQQLTYMSLAGSSAAIRSLDKQCGAAAGAVAAKQSAGQAAVPPLNIVAGYYVDEGDPCSQPGFEAFYYDGQRVGLMRGGAAGSENENFVGPIGKVTKLKGDQQLADWQLTVKVLSPTQIQTSHEEFGPVKRWCPAEQIPAGFRAPKSAAAQAGGFPPIPRGFYAVEDSCAVAAKSDMGQYVYFDDKSWNEIDGQSVIASITPAGGNNWKLNMRGGQPLTISVTGPTSFTEYGRKMTHCPTSSVPAAVQADYR